MLKCWHSGSNQRLAGRVKNEWDVQDLGLQNGAKNLVGILYLQGPDTVRSIMTYFKSTVFALTQNLEMKTKLKLKRKNIYILKQISIDLSSE